MGKTRIARSSVSWVLETPPRAWGRRPRSQKLWRCRWKHPHERGEDVRPSLTTGTGLETPPRAWGRQAYDSIGHSSVRNTPTSVGKTAEHGLQHRTNRKHPHERGEDVTFLFMVVGCLETPPRAWGRLHTSDTLSGCGGNTPTSVGKTYVSWYVVGWLGKHPHERGEDRN